MDKKAIKVEKYRQKIEELSKIDYSLLDESEGFISDGAIGGFRASIKKMHETFVRQIFIGMISGVIIVIGYSAVMGATMGVQQSWLKSLLTGIIFPGCIVLISFLGGGLLTSHMVATVPMLRGCVTKREYFKALIGILLGNYLGTFIGTFTLVIVGKFSGVWGDGLGFTKEVYSMGLHKMALVGTAIEHGLTPTAKDYALTILFVFGSGILCNFCVSATLPLTYATKNHAAAIALMFIPVMFFAMAGFQHSVANAFFWWSMLFAEIFQHGTAIGSTTYNFTHFFLFFAVNLLPAILGNFVGGGILMSGMLDLIARKRTALLYKQERMHVYERRIAELTKVKQPKKLTTKKFKIKNEQLSKKDSNSKSVS